MPVYLALVAWELRSPASDPAQDYELILSIYQMIITAISRLERMSWKIVSRISG